MATVGRCRSVVAQIPGTSVDQLSGAGEAWRSCGVEAPDSASDPKENLPTFPNLQQQRQRTPSSKKEMKKAKN